MDLESLGGGAGTGLLASVLGYLGFSRRLNKLEDGKQNKEVCDAIHKSVVDNLASLKEGQSKIFEKIDDINMFLRNGK